MWQRVRSLSVRTALHEDDEGQQDLLHVLVRHFLQQQVQNTLRYSTNVVSRPASMSKP